MSEIAIRVEGLGKSYQITHAHGGYRTLQEDLRALIKRPFTRGSDAPRKETFWALKDISFEVKTGEVLGIIGRNGAGKSTLLKILSRITKPTTGHADIYGRVGSLLEVGTGFHPELTGRENIFLNGAVLGMSRRDIQARFDEIVAFAEVEQFLDTPVKRYSSGMYMRLAFAVAAHMEPEVLVVDEVLAVGDAAFQKKCLGKMSEVAKGGRTVLFVSHNMAAVENLCTRGIVLEHGRMIFDGTQTQAILRYTESIRAAVSDLVQRPDRKGSGGVRVTGIEFHNTNGTPVDVVLSGQDVDVYLFFEAYSSKPYQQVIASIRLDTMLNVPVFLHHNRLVRTDFGTLPPRGAFVCRLTRLPLPASVYSRHYSLISHGEILDTLDNAVDFDVADGDFFGFGEVPPISHGMTLIDAEWRLETSELVKP